LSLGVWSVPEEHKASGANIGLLDGAQNFSLIAVGAECNPIDKLKAIRPPQITHFLA
jgi:hypothetical protein